MNNNKKSLKTMKKVSMPSKRRYKTKVLKSKEQ